MPSDSAVDALVKPSSLRELSAPSFSGLSKRPSQKKVVDNHARRRINGETKALVKYVQRSKASRLDSTVGDNWAADEALSFADCYVETVSFAYLGFKLAVLGIVMFLCFLPLAFWAQLHAKSLHPALERVDWKLYSSFVFKLRVYLLLAPALLPIMLSRSLDLLFYYVFSVPYALCSKGWLSRYRRSQEVLKPFRGGPAHRVGDFVVCVSGLAKRYDARSVALSLSAMVLMVPWLKYFASANPFIYPLKERFMQHISSSLQDVGVKAATHWLRRFISGPARGPAVASALSEMLPFFPFPKSKRRWAMGFQKVRGISLLFHVTHADARVQGSQEQLVFSNSAERPIYRVVMWYDNPYHWFTGWSEVSITNGYPSLQNRRFGVECPIWLVGSQSPAHCSPSGMWFGAGVLQGYFDTLLPILVDEVRSAIRGPEIAKEMKKEAALAIEARSCSVEEYGAFEEKSYAVDDDHFVKDDDHFMKDDYGGAEDEEKCLGAAQNV